MIAFFVVLALYSLATRKTLPYGIPVKKLLQLGLSQRFRGRNPRQNLPRILSNREPEARLLKLFEKLYLNEISTPSVCLFDLDLPGYGIPDLIWISWYSSVNGDGTAISYEMMQKRLKERRLSAFEIKVSNWKKALLQAQRYRYFADRSFVILPVKTAIKARVHLEAFKEVKVGLWGIDVDSKKLVKYYTPVGTRPLNSEAKKKLSERILKGLKLRKFTESAKP